MPTTPTRPARRRLPRRGQATTRHRNDRQVKQRRSVQAWRMRKRIRHGGLVERRDLNASPVSSLQLRRRIATRMPHRQQVTIRPLRSATSREHQTWRPQRPRRVRQPETGSPKAAASAVVYSVLPAMHSARPSTPAKLQAQSVAIWRTSIGLAKDGMGSADNCAITPPHCRDRSTHTPPNASLRRRKPTDRTRIPAPCHKNQWGQSKELTTARQLSM